MPILPHFNQFFSYSVFVVDGNHHQFRWTGLCHPFMPSYSDTVLKHSKKTKNKNKNKHITLDQLVAKKAGQPAQHENKSKRMNADHQNIFVPLLKLHKSSSGGLLTGHHNRHARLKSSNRSHNFFNKQLFLPLELFYQVQNFHAAVPSSEIKNHRR